MDPLHAFDCGLEGVCILACLVMLFQLRSLRENTRAITAYKVAIVSNIFMLIGDMSDWILSGSDFPAVHTLYEIGITTFFVASGFVLFSFFSFIFYYTDSKKPQPRLFLNIAMVFVVFEIVLALASSVTGVIFTINHENIYIRGPLFMITQLSSIVVFGLAFILLFRAWGSLTARERVYFLSYLALPIIGEVIQVITYGVAALPVAITLTFLLVNTFIHTENARRLEEAERELERGRMEALQDKGRMQNELVYEIITALGNAVEAKDRYTNGHSRRVAKYAHELARRMGIMGEELKNVYYAGLLHDVGKIHVPDSILTKEGRLTNDEFDEIKLHPLAGYYILKEVSSVRDFALGARWHHERYDGHGYPNELEGENIPRIARIIAVADAYDAMTSRRIYRDSLSQEAVRAEIANNLGTQFDPEIGAIMLDMIDEDKHFDLRQKDTDVCRTILAVDDNEFSLQRLHDLLKAEPSYHMLRASSGKAAVTILQEDQVDLVLLDMIMPGMDGFEVLEWIRSHYPAMPVIFLTVSKDLSNINHAERLGINGYLTKPLSGRQVLESIRNVLQNADALE